MSNHETIRTLAIEYKELTGYEADGRWGVPKLTKEIESAKVRSAENRAAKEAREAKKQAEKDARQALIAERGPAAEFALNREYKGENGFRLRRLIKGCLDAIESFSAVKAEFAADLDVNPIYAMERSRNLFSASAKFEVATLILQMFEGGRSAQYIFEECTSKALSAARSPSRSTCQTTNLMGQYRTEAWASAADKDSWF